MESDIQSSHYHADRHDGLRQWLKCASCEENYDDFLREDVTMDLIIYLTKRDLKLFIPKVGDRVRLWNAIGQMKATGSLQSSPQPSSPGRESHLNSPKAEGENTPNERKRSPIGDNRGLQTPRTPNPKINPLASDSPPRGLSTSSRANSPSLPEYKLSKSSSPVEGSENKRVVTFHMPIKHEVLKISVRWHLPLTSADHSRAGADLRQLALEAAAVDSDTHDITDEFEVLSDIQICEYALNNQQMVIDPVATPNSTAGRKSAHELDRNAGLEKPRTVSEEPVSALGPLRSEESSADGYRPTSEHVSKNMNKYFPNARPEQLEETHRASRRFSWRLSMLPTGHKSWRLSRNLLNGAEDYTAAVRQRFSSLASPVTHPHQVEEELMRPPLKWLIGKELGKGSFGEVHIAANQLTGELLAVKRAALGNGGDRWKLMVDTLQHEVEMLRELEHENIVQYRGCTTEENHLNIFLEYVSGGSLQAMVQTMGNLSESMIRSYVSQILKGLEYLHSRNIIHRDIKGANILVSDKAKIKISDFGLSKKVSSANRLSMKGSPFWIAPEVIRQTGVTTKSDIWSLGCVLIELSTGQHPFPELESTQALYQIGRYVKPTVPNSASPQLRDFLDQCLQTDPEKRPTATELLSHTFLEAATPTE